MKLRCETLESISSDQMTKMSKKTKAVIAGSILILLTITIILNLSTSYDAYEGQANSPHPYIGPEDEMMTLSVSISNNSDNEQDALTTAAIIPSEDYVNPGCINRTLNAYRPLQTSKTYDHPSVVHYVKLSPTTGDEVTISFREYIAMMSAYKLLRPKEILVHSNVDRIRGEYWDLVQKWLGTSVTVNKVSRVTSLNGKHVNWIENAADYVKVSQLLEHGGLVMDFDVIVINGTRFKEEQRRSECVIAQEGHTLNAGFVSCTKNSSFVRQWLDGYHSDYRPTIWVHNAADVPRDILLGKLSSACYNMYLDDTICINPGWEEASKQWLSHGGVPDWRQKTAAHYFLNRVNLPTDADKLLSSNTSLGEMLRFIYDY